MGWWKRFRHKRGDKPGTGVKSKLFGTLFCCFRCCKHGILPGTKKYYETHYAGIDPKYSRSSGSKYVDIDGELRIKTDSRVVLARNYGSFQDRSSGFREQGENQIDDWSRSSECRTDGLATTTVNPRSVSSVDRVKAKLRHRQVKNKHKLKAENSHLTAVSVTNKASMLLPIEKRFHELARTGNLEEVNRFIKEKNTSRLNVNCMDEKDRSALHLAAGQGHVEVIRSLLDADVSVDAADKFGMNAMLWAAWFGHDQAMEALVMGQATVKCENKQGLTIVHCAASRGHINVLKYIVENHLEEDNMESDDEEGGILPSIGAVGGKVTGLFGAAASLLGTKTKKDEEKNKSHKIRPESSFMEQRNSAQGSKTPLHLAAENGMTDAMDYLISVKCNKLARTSDGSTALHLAAKRGQIDMVNLLLVHELEVDIRNEEGMTPLLFAAEEGHANVVELLLTHKAGCNVKANEKRKEMAAIHFAAQNNHCSVIKVLSSFSTDLDAKCQGGDTAIHLSSAAGHLDGLKTLISNGASVNIFNDRKRLALHVATENNLTDVVEQLLLAGAWVHQVDKTGKTALMMAARAENVTITDMIIKADRFFTKRKNEGRPYRRGKEQIQFRKESTEEQRQMKPILWKLATKQLAQDDATRLIFYWGFSAEQIKAVQSQYTGPKSWKEHTYRMLLIWLHGAEVNPLKGLYEGLVAIERKTLAENIRKKANMKLDGKGSGCTVS
ncbi:uncharacterized protein [Asterias amurensis]|uniref:uncharacterized protein n=1 Tax=Asterias amurensis TaxID=7602 RepID=UPI003AB6B91A